MRFLLVVCLLVCLSGCAKRFDVTLYEDDGKTIMRVWHDVKVKPAALVVFPTEMIARVWVKRPQDARGYWVRFAGIMTVTGVERYVQ